MMGLFLNLTLTQAWIPPFPLSFNAPGWTLSVEAALYILFPMIVVMLVQMKKKFSYGFVWGFWLVSLFVHTYLMNNPTVRFDHDILHYSPLFHFSSFFLGILAGMYYKQELMDKPTNPKMNMLSLWGSLMVIIALISLRGPINSILGFSLPMGNGFLAPFYLWFIIALARSNGLISRIFRHKWAVLLGDASYGVYLLQNPLHEIYEKYLIGFIPKDIPAYHAVQFYVFHVFLVVIAIMLFKWFEMPVRDWIRKAKIFKEPSAA